MLLLFFLLTNYWTQHFTVSVNNLTEARGQVLIAAYDRQEYFLKPDKAFFKQVLPVGKTGSVQFVIPQSASGSVALSCFHDLNNNGELDKNLLGVPTEPYGFSNNARPSFRAPSWEEANVDPKTAAALSIQLEKW